MLTKFGHRTDNFGTKYSTTFEKIEDGGLACRGLLCMCAFSLIQFAGTLQAFKLNWSLLNTLAACRSCAFSIVDEATSRDRFVRVVQWYLSVFHAGRRSSVAKKPYNPVLGEIFRCYYDLQDDGQEKVTAAFLPHFLGFIDIAFFVKRSRLFCRGCCTKFWYDCNCNCNYID